MVGNTHSERTVNEQPRITRVLTEGYVMVENGPNFNINHGIAELPVDASNEMVLCALRETRANAVNRGGFTYFLAGNPPERLPSESWPSRIPANATPDDF